MVVGSGALARLGDELERLGAHRPLIVCGQSTARDARLRDALEAALPGGGLEVADHVRPNVPEHSVRQVADAIVNLGVDALVAIGGGGAITTSRAANVFAHEPHGLADLSTRIDAEGGVTSPRLTGTRLPQVVVPTTPTTATPKAGAAVTVDRRRRALYDPRTRASSVIVDVDLSASVPPDPTLAATLNAYVMALEGWMSTRRHPFSDVILRGAVAELAQVLVAPPVDAPRPTERAMMAAIAVGEATDVTGGGMTAALSHTLGPLLDAPNGVIDALLLPHVCAAANGTQRARLDDLDRALGVHALDVLHDALAVRPRSSRLRDLGLPRDAVDVIARDCLDDVSAWTDPHPDPRTHARDILAAAW
jgi:alcohol dehydrogenase class IV